MCSNVVMVRPPDRICVRAHTLAFVRTFGFTWMRRITKSTSARPTKSGCGETGQALGRGHHVGPRRARTTAARKTVKAIPASRDQTQAIGEGPAAPSMSCPNADAFPRTFRKRSTKHIDAAHDCLLRCVPDREAP